MGCKSEAARVAHQSLTSSRNRPYPPGLFVLHDGMGLVAKRVEHIPSSDPARLRITSDNPSYSQYECLAEEVNVVGRVRWYGRAEDRHDARFAAAVARSVRDRAAALQPALP
jgi:hypothetical protein